MLIDQKIFQQDDFYVRMFQAEDFEKIGEIIEAEDLFRNMYKADPKIMLLAFWNTILGLENDYHYAIYLKNGDILGRLALQSVNKEYPELAIVIVEKYQNKGYGERVLRGWLPWIKEHLGYSKILVNIESRNVASMQLFNKLGIIVEQQEDGICHGYLDI